MSDVGTLISNISSYIVVTAVLSSFLCGNVLGTLTWSTLIEITGFGQSASAFLDVSTFRLGNIPVVTCTRSVAAVLGGATGEFVRHVLVDARFFGCRKG